MAEAAGGGDDIKIKVGAEANTKEAQQKILAEFEAMRKKLSLVGTEEAEALAEQISAVTKGLREGTVDPKSVEAVAAAFTKIASAAELSDREISGFASQLKTAVDKSRSLSDFMRSEAKDTGNSSKGMSDIKDALSDLAPEATRVSGEIGKWANRIPGVNKIMQAMPKAAMGIGVAFTAALAAVFAFRNALKEANAAMREARERAYQLKGEDAQNAFTNTNADIDKAAKRRQEDLEHAKAMLALNEKAIQLEQERVHHAEMAYVVNEREREQKQRQYERDKAYEESQNKMKVLEKDAEEIKAKEEDLNQKEAALKERIKAEKEQLAEAQRLNKEAAEMRSSIKQDAEAMETLRAAGIDIDDESQWSKAMDVLGSKMSDWWNDMLAPFKGNLTTEEANAKYISSQDDARKLEQSIIGLERTLAEMSDERVALENEAEQNKIEKYNVAYEIDTKAARDYAEDMARKRAYDDRMVAAQMDTMKNSNRLTAMGLGSGNAAANTTKEISVTTKDILNELRSFKGAPKEAFTGLGGSDIRRPLTGVWAIDEANGR